MKQRKQRVVGNWKMNGNSESMSKLISGILSRLEEVVSSLNECCEVIIAPPFPYLSHVAREVKDTFLQLSAQDVSPRPEGAFTGEVAASMLVDNGCRYTIVGHSERRHYWQETNEVVANKFKAAREGGLFPILCVGETQKERESEQTKTVIMGQIDAIIQKVGMEGFEGAVIAYEPVWAIGTGLQATPKQAQEVHAAVRKRIAQESLELSERIPVLYGGSVKPDSAIELFKQPDVDGALVGGSSLDAKQFSEIALAAIKCQGASY